jgi:mannosyltransferase OCH1-like enzyme
MIPKRIISMWIGGPIPEIAKKCVETHKLPGYEHMWINDSNIPSGLDSYFYECMEVENYGKASDYLRMELLERWGGIYLDADTQILKPFDDVLDNEMFVCEEKNYFIANGIVGSVAHHPILQDYLGKLTRNFNGYGELVFQPGMGLWTECIKQGPYLNRLKIYPEDWFLPFNHQTGVTNITENSHTIHYYLKSWQL